MLFVLLTLLPFNIFPKTEIKTFQGAMSFSLPVFASGKASRIRRLQVELDQRRDDDLLQEDRRGRAGQFRPRGSRGSHRQVPQE